MFMQTIHYEQIKISYDPRPTPDQPNQSLAISVLEKTTQLQATNVAKKTTALMTSRAGYRHNRLI
jgi:hypothetical protein